MFYILANNNANVGNPKGYRTHAGALRQAEFNLKIKCQIDLIFDTRANKADNLYFSIRTIAKVA